MVHLAVLWENYWSFPSWKAAKKNGLVLGVNNVVWGSDGDLRVPASRNMAPCQERWVEKKNGLFGSFERELLVFFLPESGQEKQACFRGKYICLKALMGVPGVSADQYIAPCQEWGGLRKKLFIWQFWKRITGFYLLANWLKKMGLFWGLILLFGGSEEGPRYREPPTRLVFWKKTCSKIFHKELSVSMYGEICSAS